MKRLHFQLSSFARRPTFPRERLDAFASAPRVQSFSKQSTLAGLPDTELTREDALARAVKTFKFFKQSLSFESSSNTSM